LLVGASLEKLQRLQALQNRLAELDRLDAARYTHNPVGWVRDPLGEHVWSKQAEVIRAIAAHPLVAVQSGHGIGKSHLASRLVGWFLDTRPSAESFVVTTAPTAPQLRAMLWRYITQVSSTACPAGSPKPAKGRWPAP